MRKSKLSSRITWRLTLIRLVFGALFIGAVFLFDLFASAVESKERAQYIMSGIDDKMTAMLSGVHITATNNVAEFETNLDSPEQVCKAMEHELQLNNRYLGCGLGFEPDYFPSQGRWLEPYVRLVDTARVECVQIGSALHDYHHQEWYLEGRSLARGEGRMTDPYVDHDGGKTLLSTYVTPVFDRQGRWAGVYGIDLNLSWIEQTIDSEEERVRRRSLIRDIWEKILDKENDFFIQILDSKGKKIAGSDTIDSKVLNVIMQQDSIRFERVRLNDAAYYVSSKRLAHTGWTVVVAQHTDFVFLEGYILGIILSFFIILNGIVMFILTSHDIRRAIKPLRYLSDSAREVAQGNFDTPLPTFSSQDEIAHLRDSFDTMQQSLKQYVEQLKATTASKASFERELNIAHSIQMSMLPKTFPPFPERNDLELYATLKPAKAVGGDLYDFFIRDEKLYFCIGDVSGKGVPASLVMAVTRTLFRNVAAHTAEPSLIVEAMNQGICDSNDNNMFVTFFVGVLDLPTGHLRYCNAAHNIPYLQKVLLPCDPNLPVGVMPDWSFTVQEADMPSGALLFLYTDGLTEAENARRAQFGDQRVSSVVTSFEGTPEELIETMTAAVRQFVGDTEQSDDLTMLAIKYKN